MTDDPVLARSRGLVLQKAGDARFKIQTDGDLAAGWAMGIFFVLGRVIPMFVCSAMLIVIMLIKVDGMARKFVLGVSTLGALVALSVIAIWAGYREVAARHFPRNFELDTERRVLTLRESARWTQTFSFVEVTSANLDFSDKRHGNLAILSIDLRNPHRQLIVQIRRLAEYRRKDRLDEIAAVGEAAAALMGSSFPAYWI